MLNSTKTLASIILIALVCLTFLIIKPFLNSALWAIVLAILFWPIKIHLIQKYKLSNNFAALLITVISSILFLSIFFLIFILLEKDGIDFVKAVKDYLIKFPTNSELVKLKIIGPVISETMNLIKPWIENFQSLIFTIVQKQSVNLINLIKNTTYLAFDFLISMFALFNFLKYGDDLINFLRVIMSSSFSSDKTSYVNHIGVMIKAVTKGLILTSTAQGLMATIGFIAVGVSSPLILGVVTALLSIIPFAGAIIWVSVSISLIIEGRLLAGSGLFLWGLLVVSLIDNFIRPFIISSEIKQSFTLLFFGILGGLSAFGLIGVFIGPVILSVLTKLFHEFSKESKHIKM